MIVWRYIYKDANSYARTDQQYFSLDSPGQFTFRVEGNGNASGLTIHAFGSDRLWHANRIGRVARSEKAEQSWEVGW